MTEKIEEFLAKIHPNNWATPHRMKWMFRIWLVFTIIVFTGYYFWYIGKPYCERPWHENTGRCYQYWMHHPHPIPTE